MDNPIGIFDSGLGGLTAFKELSQILPGEDIIYFGDTGRVPYGNKSHETILKYAIQNINFLKSFKVKMIIAACGTVSSIMSGIIDQVSVPFVGVVFPTALTACNITKNKKIGVIGTSTTITSLSYKKQIKKIDSSIKVYTQDCPLFVPLVENGFTSPDDPVVELIIERHLKKIRENNVDTLILGCTHYPILSESIKKFMGENISLVNSGKEAAIYAAQVLREEGIQAAMRVGSPLYQFYVSDKTSSFSETAKIFLNKDISDLIQQVDIEKY